MAYGSFIDRKEKREKICSLGDSMDAPAGDVLEVLEEAPLYTSLCDLMGLDLYRVMVEIGNSKAPVEVAAGYSYLFLDREFMDACVALDGDVDKGGVEAGRNFTKLRGLFDWLHYLKAWFVGCRRMTGSGIRRGSGVMRSIYWVRRFLHCCLWKMTRRMPV